MTFQPSTRNAGLPGVPSHDLFLKDGQGSSFPQTSVRIFKCFDLKIYIYCMKTIKQMSGIP